MSHNFPKKHVWIHERWVEEKTGGPKPYPRVHGSTLKCGNCGAIFMHIHKNRFRFVRSSKFEPGEIRRQMRRLLKQDKTTCDDYYVQQVMEG